MNSTPEVDATLRAAQELRFESGTSRFFFQKALEMLVNKAKELECRCAYLESAIRSVGNTEYPTHDDSWSTWAERVIAEAKGRP